MMTKRHVGVIALTASVLLATACFEKIPVKELSLAKNALSEAAAVKADHYAKDEFEQANALLLSAHDDVKNEEYDKAKQKAIDAEKKARAAHDKAIPLLAKDTLDIAVASVQHADDVYAAVLAREDFIKAHELLEEAKKQYENKAYIASYKAALDADMHAKNARNLSLNQKEMLSDAVKEVNIVIAQAESYNASHYAPAKLALAKEHSLIARAAYDTNELKKGFSAIEVAKLNADDAYFTSIRATAEKQIEEAAASIETAKASEAGKTSAADINAAQESLGQARRLFNDSRYRESLLASGQAMTIARGVSAKKAAVAAVDQGALIEGQAKQEDQKAAIDKMMKEETEYVMYRVRYNPARRDCLWRIAEKFFNDGFQWKKIYEANKDIITNPNLIKPGWMLKIPKGSTKVNEPAKQKQEREDYAIRETESDPPTTELRLKTE